MSTDPVVEEIRAIRRQIAAEAGYDLHAICQRARTAEAGLGPSVAAPSKAIEPGAAPTGA